jgi:exonuclease SbcC
MKILSLKFKNINSLSGENEIDFTNPVFSNEGIFVITGKTGAGKSTILDAICLALYGKTPRVEISGSENAVMTRGEKDCYAEIIFEAGTKKWKSSWKHELNKNGNFRPLQRVIADAENTIVADQIRACDTKIIEITGLTFEQFTKVVMLAQGSFAAFLQAGKNEKGEILEQITGTEIYAEISRNVFQRKNAEQEKLLRISAELSNIKVLSEEDFNRIKQEIALFEEQKLQSDSEIKKVENIKQWLTELTQIKKQIEESRSNLPEFTERFNIAEEFYAKTQRDVETVKKEKEVLEPIFRKVREIETKITEKEKSLKSVQDSLQIIKNEQLELLSKKTNQQEILKLSQYALTEKENWLKENSIYESLLSNYNAIEKENQLLIEKQVEIEKSALEIKNLESDSNQKKSKFQKASEDLITKEKNYKVASENLKNKNTELAELLGSKDRVSIQAEKDYITSFGKLIKDILDLENEIVELKIELTEIEILKERSLNQKVSLSEIIKADRFTLQNIDNQIKLLEENIQLTKTILGLEDHRKNLKDGEECPLCGAMEHPFAMGNIPELGEKESELGGLKNQQKKLNDDRLANEKSYSKLEADFENALKNKEKTEEKLKQINAKLESQLSDLKILNTDYTIPPGEGRIKKLNETIIQKRTELIGINELLKKIDEFEAQIIRLRDNELPDLQDKKQVAEKLKIDFETEYKLAEQKLKSGLELLAGLNEKYKSSVDSFSDRLKIYAVDNINSLKKCLDSWNENKTMAEQLEKSINQIIISINLLEKDLESNTKHLAEKQHEGELIDQEKRNLQSERNEIFAENSVEEVEMKLQEKIKSLENLRNAAESEKNESFTNLEKCKAVIESKEKELSGSENLYSQDKSLEELAQLQSELKNKSDDLSEKIGADNQILNANQDNLKTFNKRIKEKESQEAIFKKWNILNELIGSKEGVKYRNFAQALTFEHLIALSNRQLQKMSDRYILKRTDDNTNPFDLSVIDKFQNCEERTAQNLSGGEKFIMSLALALGLSSMAGKNMRIDTMFIDEGFGTLDSDYLDVALNALSNLQQEGKIIGVISHISELKERIATHLEVVPTGNGKSTLRLS